MIIKGKAAQSTKFWSKHLLRDDTNEKAELREVRGVLAKDLEEALEEMRDVAKGSRCHKNFMYQANINPRADERLTPEQWQHAVDTLEKNLGFEGHQRVVVEHVKEGRQHFHVIWSRIDPDTMRVTDIGGDRYTMRRTAMELEREFELSRTKPVREYDDPRPHTLQDKEREKRTGVDHEAMKRQLTEVWQRTQTGAEFKKEVEAQGYVIARGDKVEYALIDPTGGVHSLSRRLEAVKAKDLRERFVDLDRQALPSVEQARQQLGHDRTNGVERDKAGEESKRSLTDEHKAQGQPDRQGSVYQNAPSIQAEQIEFDFASTARGPIEVIDAATMRAEKVADVVLDFLGGARPQPCGTAAEALAEYRANAALTRMAESQARGERLQAADVAALTHHQLLNVRDKGDDYLRQLIDDNEKHSRENYVDSQKREEKERERER
ncbi:MAG: relaxase/mobilization nuclease domain-containing protein [Rhodomicrobium sp.]